MLLGLYVTLVVFVVIRDQNVEDQVKQHHELMTELVDLDQNMTEKAVSHSGEQEEITDDTIPIQ